MAAKWAVPPKCRPEMVKRKGKVERILPEGGADPRPARRRSGGGWLLAHR
jgi:hypothetical protein